MAIDYSAVIALDVRYESRKFVFTISCMEKFLYYSLKDLIWGEAC